MMAFGTVGLASAITLLMVLSPVGAGVLVHRNTVLAAPYKGTVSSPNSYMSVSGCASAKAGKPAWSATTGHISAMMAASAKTCAKSLGSVGAYSGGYAQNGESVAIPFKVASNGMHSITTAVTTTLASTFTFSSGGCPAKNLNYNPPLYAYSYAYCEAGGNVEFELSANVVDLNNASWYGNYSYGFTYNDSGWENYSYCSNYGTPSCSNTTGPFGYSFGFGYNEVGFSSMNFNGVTGVTMYNNGTNMVKGHHYVLELSVYLYGGAFADAYGLLAHWTGSAATSINGATLGNGIVVSSVTIA